MGAVIPVAGVSHRQDLVKALTVDEPVLLWHDTSNTYDPNAVAISTGDGQLIGYVPARTGLALRLAGATPGGRWNAVVCDILPGETWGVRVRINQLAGTSDGRTGAGVRGVRDKTDHTGLAEPSGTQAASSTDEPCSIPAASGQRDDDQSRTAVEVRTRTGRLLGVLVETAGTSVRVKDDQGRIATYPAAALAPIDL